MEFWGVEVKGGKALKVTPDDGCVIHISQAALGEVKKEKGTDFIPLKLKINGSTVVVGTLSAEKIPQLTFDLVLEKEFELSHDWKNGSVYFCGYTAENPEHFGDSEDELTDEEDEQQITTQNGNAKPELAKAKGKAAKPETSAKPTVKVVEPEKDDDSDEDDSDDIDDSDEDDSEMDSMDEDSDDSEDDSEDEETPKKVEPVKKRPSESAAKTPVSGKKAKLETPQKTDGKKGSAHVATPHPSKKGEKTPASGNKSKGKEKQSPKSGGTLSCGSCSKTFNSDGALQSHSKAKHAAK